jgi:hypothetical protein
MRDFLSIFKDGPVASDVHVSSTGGPAKPKKPQAPKLPAMNGGVISQNAKLPVTNATAAAQAENPDDDAPTNKRGARNSRADQNRIQAIHDHACSLGAACDDPDGDDDNDAGLDDPDSLADDAIAQLLGKRAGDGGWSIPFTITKADADQQLIFGWASTSEINGQLVIDQQGDGIAPEDLEKAAYDFVLYARKHGDMHENVGTGRLVESMMFTREKQDILGIDLGKTAWWVGFKVDDPATWAAHKRGELPEFSIGGTGRRVPIKE